MKQICNYAIFTMLIGITLLLSGCASSPQSRFYTLTATAAETAGKPDQTMPSIAIASVTIPELVNRPQMVIRAEGSQVELLETHRWAEPLKNSIPLTVAENIARILGTDQVSTYHQSASNYAELKVYLDIQRFESIGNQVMLDALWTIRPADGKTMQSGRTRVVEKVGASGFDAIAAAFSQAVGRLSQDIASALKNERPSKK
jgi:uncharacterized lipoprotein YmbA